MSREVEDVAAALTYLRQWVKDIDGDATRAVRIVLPEFSRLLDARAEHLRREADLEIARRHAQQSQDELDRLRESTNQTINRLRAALKAANERADNANPGQ